MLLNVVVCDDDVNALNQEAQLIREVCEEKEIEYDMHTFNFPEDVIKSGIKYDLAFLDIEMTGMNGIELAKLLAEKNKYCLIFFLTNYSVYLDKAFDVNAIRYFTKPIDRSRLSAGIDSAMERIEMQSKKIILTILSSKEKISVELSEILCIENVGRHTKVITSKYGDIEVKEIFSYIRNLIETAVNYFAYSHQSYFVNLRYVIKYTKKTVTVAHEGKIYEATMTRRRYKEFNDKFFEVVNKLR